jgi:hypothetical protein
MIAGGDNWLLPSSCRLPQLNPFHIGDTVFRSVLLHFHAQLLISNSPLPAGFLFIAKILYVLWVI